MTSRGESGGAKPRVINRKVLGSPPGAVYVGQGTPFASPFQVGRDGTAQEVRVRYERWLYQRPDLLALARERLRGKDLVCECPTGQCHAEVLLRIANVA